MAEHDLMIRTGMVSVIDTHDIVIEHSFVGRNHVGDDAMHWGYVTGGEIRDCRFDGARSDALDMDICGDVTVAGCTFANSGNDCLDLMTSVVRIVGCTFTNGGDKGVSVGEATRAQISRVTIVGCATGIEIKDNSLATVDDRTVIDGCETGINLYRKNPRYSRGGTLEAEVLRISNSRKDAVRHDARSTVPADLRHILRVGGGT